MEIKLNKQQERFIRILIENRSDISLDEISKRTKELDLQIESNKFVVATVDVVFDDDCDNKDLLINNIIEDINNLLFDKDVEGYCLASNYNNFWLFLGADIELNELLIFIKKFINEKYNFESFVGVGRVVDNLQGLSISAVESQEVLKYKNSFKNNGIISIDDITAFSYRSTIGTSISYQKVINSFIAGDIDMMNIQLDKLIEEIRFTPQVSKSSIRRTMVELTVNVLNIATNMKVDVEKVLNGIDPYTWIISQGHTEVITAWFVDLCRKLNSEMNDLHNTNDDSIIQKVCKYIDLNLDDESLGLVSISEYVNLSQPYLSQLFKKQMGKGINSYIKDLRINKAKSMLRNSRLKVDEIAKECGFASCSYFNQVFKKNVKVSPIDFRYRKY